MPPDGCTQFCCILNFWWREKQYFCYNILLGLYKLGCGNWGVYNDIVEFKNKLSEPNIEISTAYKTSIRLRKNVPDLHISCIWINSRALLLYIKGTTLAVVAQVHLILAILDRHSQHKDMIYETYPLIGGEEHLCLLQCLWFTWMCLHMLLENWWWLHVRNRIWEIWSDAVIRND